MIKLLIKLKRINSYMSKRLVFYFPNYFAQLDCLFGKIINPFISLHELIPKLNLAVDCCQYFSFNLYPEFLALVYVTYLKNSLLLLLIIFFINVILILLSTSLKILADYLWYQLKKYGSFINVHGHPESF